MDIGQRQLTADQEEKILILGLGLSGSSAAELAKKHGAAVTVLDVGGSATLQDSAELLRHRGIDVCLEWNEKGWNAPVDLVVISPGVHPDSLLGRLGASLSCPLVGELEFGFRYCSCPILAVTGTNGKTTTVELLVHCLRHAGRKVIAAGNVGVPLCEAVRRSAALDFLVVEVSSFQLEHISRFAPLAAALLNVTPDHLDRYESFDTYMGAKLQLFKNVSRCCKIVLREDLIECDTVNASLPGDESIPICFTSRESLFAAFFVAEDGMLCQRTSTGVLPLLSSAQVRLDGRHNVENVLAALALAQAAGILPSELASHVSTFVPKRHRLELVAINDGVRFVNDSKATNVDSLSKGLVTSAERSSGKILLIAGGDDKGIDFVSVIALLAKYVKEVFLIGRCRERLAKQWGHVVSCKTFVSLAVAVDVAADAAVSGDTVLLSPGCASQDMFVDYADRGQQFCELVKRRIGE